MASRCDLRPHELRPAAAANRLNLTARSSSSSLNRGGRAPGRGTTMPTAVIVDAVRTAGGKRYGKLSGWHSADLAAETLKALVERNNLDPALVEDVIMGCVMQ